MKAMSLAKSSDEGESHDMGGLKKAIDALSAQPVMKEAYALDGDYPMSDSGPPVNILWTGGFDSTTLLIRRLRAGRRVQPVYMRHSPASQKSRSEDRAREQIPPETG